MGSQVPGVLLFLDGSRDQSLFAYGCVLSIVHRVVRVECGEIEVLCCGCAVHGEI